MSKKRRNQKQKQDQAMKRYQEPPPGVHTLLVIHRVDRTLVVDIYRFIFVPAALKPERELTNTDLGLGVALLFAFVLVVAVVFAIFQSTSGQGVGTVQQQQDGLLFA